MSGPVLSADPPGLSRPAPPGDGTGATGPRPPAGDAREDAPTDAPVPMRRWTQAGWQPRAAAPLPAEAAVAVVIDGASQAVLMATPHELEDFALGFALTEGLIASARDVIAAEVAGVSAPLPGLAAFEARLWLRPGLGAGLAERRRSMVGPVGCGLCGVDSIAAALPPVLAVRSDLRLTPAEIAAAMAALSAGQARWRETPAIHAACLWTRAGALVREDVGRHNALDKLAGALARPDPTLLPSLPPSLDPAGGAVAMTSRLSVDLVQKTARLGAPVLIGAGVPTRLAVVWADAAGITLIGRARGAGFDVFTHPDRIEG